MSKAKKTTKIDPKKVMAVASAFKLERRPRAKELGGSEIPLFNRDIVESVLGSRPKFPGEGEALLRHYSTVAALSGIDPRNEIEGMLAAQLIATHNAAMECLRLSVIPGQLLPAIDHALNHASKLCRTFATLLDALNRYRGKGQQKVTVEHVHVQPGGQAIVGVIEGGGGEPEDAKQPHAKRIAHAPQRAMRSSDEEKETMLIAGDAERPLSDARRRLHRGAKGKQKCA